MILVDVAYKKEVDNPRVFAFRVIVYEVGLLEAAQAVYDSVDHLVETHDLAHHGTEFWEERVV